MISPGVVNWISQQHRRLAGLRGTVLVIKVGGSIQDDPAQLRGVMRDVAALVSLGAHPVVIHGGGKAITAAMSKAGLQARFVQGQRYTDEATLRIAEEVLVGGVNRELCEYLREEGVRAAGLHSVGTCALRAKRTGTDDGQDLGFVGRVCEVDVRAVMSALERRETPVIAPVALDAEPAKGGPGKLNVNADLAGGTVAAALKPGAFVLVSDTAGVRTGPEKADPSASTLSKAQVERLISSGVIAGGMLPKLTACFEALDAGVPRVCIVDGREAETVLAAVLAEPGEPIAGTWVTR